MGNLTLNGSTSGSITLTPTAVAGSNTITLPAVTDTVTTNAASQTLTNKTLTSPSISTPTISSGNLTFSGSNAGIVFNASGALVNSTLNDYETGTWTPAYIGGTTNPTVSYVSQSGNYVKIGRMVMINIFLNSSNVSGGSGNLLISGLPFTPTASGGIAIGNTAYWTTVPTNIFVYAASSSLQLMKSSNTNMLVSDLYQGASSANYLWASGVYFV
jgi:hypothetical protein